MTRLESRPVPSRLGGYLIRRIGALALLAVVHGCTTSAVAPQYDARGTLSPAGYIPNEATAVAVALAVLSAAFGDQKIREELPLHATLSEGVWLVRGTLHQPADPNYYTIGGVAEIEIDSRTGRIIRMSYGR